MIIEGYEHRTGEHCASTALRNMLRFHGLPLSEEMVFGLSGGLGFFSIRSDGMSPRRMFAGRTMSLESDLCENAAIPVEGSEVADDARAWDALRARLDEGIPVMLSTDTFHLAYHQTTSHFPKHRAVAVGYDEASEQVFIADRKFPEVQSAGFAELRKARNAPDYPVSCQNEYNHFRGAVSLGVPLPVAIRRAVARNAAWMLEGSAERDADVQLGIRGMRVLADDFPSWATLADWSWAARFGYQMIVKRGAGGHFFRSLYAGFLAEVAGMVPAFASAGVAGRFSEIAAGWIELAEVLKEQSERDTCDPSLFAAAGDRTRRLADEEERAFGELRALAGDDAVWSRAG